jgi:hypothetical protein
VPLRPASRGSLAAAGGAWLVRFSRSRRGGTDAKRSRHRPRRLLCSDSCPSARSVTDHAHKHGAPHHLSNLRALCCREVGRPPAQLTQLTLPLRVELRPHCRRLGPRELIQPRTVISQSVCQSASLRSVGQTLQLRTCCKASWFASRRRFADAAAVAAVPRTVLGQPTVSHGVVPSASTCLCAGTCADAACCSLLSQVGRFGSLQDTTNRVNRDKRRQIAASHLAFGATTAAARGRLRGLRVSAALASATATLETWQQLLQQL